MGMELIFHRITIIVFCFTMIVGIFRVSDRLRAEYYIAKGDIEKATEVAPFHYRNLWIRSMGEFSRKDCRGATKTLSRILELAPNHWNAMNNLALCYALIRDLDGAEVLWRKVLKQWPYHKVARKNLDTLLQMRRKNGSKLPYLQ